MRKNQNIQALVLTPQLSLPGGVSSFYLKWLRCTKFQEFFDIFEHGRRRSTPGFFFVIHDVIKFLFKASSKNIKFIVLNPSMQRNAILRDLIFAIVSYCLRKRVCVLIHGWDQSFFQKKKTSWSLSLFLSLTDIFLFSVIAFVKI